MSEILLVVEILGEKLLRFREKMSLKLSKLWFRRDFIPFKKFGIKKHSNVLQKLNITILRQNDLEVTFYTRFRPFSYSMKMNSV